MFHAVTKCIKANFSIVNVILHDFVLVQPTSVAVVQILWKIPVVQGLCGGFIKSRIPLEIILTYDERNNTVFQQLVDEP